MKASGRCRPRPPVRTRARTAAAPGRPATGRNLPLLQHARQLHGQLGGSAGRAARRARRRRGQPSPDTGQPAPCRWVGAAPAVVAHGPDVGPRPSQEGVGGRSAADLRPEGLQAAPRCGVRHQPAQTPPRCGHSVRQACRALRSHRPHRRNQRMALTDFDKGPNSPALCLERCRRPALTRLACRRPQFERGITWWR